MSQSCGQMRSYKALQKSSGQRFAASTARSHWPYANELVISAKVTHGSNMVGRILVNLERK